MNPMDDQKARKDAATAFVNYASKLDKDIYEHLMRLVVKVGHRALSPNSFRAKIKYVLRDSWDHIPNLINPLLPDEYQLSQELLQKKAEDYKKFEIIEKYIIFVNQLNREVKTSQALSLFLELVKSHQRKEIDAKELYGRVYNQLGGDFGLMKQLSNILDEKLTPSYISVPVQLWETSTMSEDGVLNNNRLRIDNRMSAVEDIQKVDSNYLYEVDALVEKKYFGSTPTKAAASSWIDDRRDELELLSTKLELAAKEVQTVIEKIDSGELNEESALREHLRGHSVRVRLRPVERMFPKLKELLMFKPRETFQYVFQGLRKRKLQVAMSLLEIHRNIHKNRIQRHVYHSN